MWNSHHGLRPALAGLALLLALAAGGGPPARALCGDTDAGFGLEGSLRILTIAFDNYPFEPFFGPDNPSDGRSLSLLRLIAAGAPDERWSYAVHLVGDLDVTSGVMAIEAQGFGLVPGVSRYRAVDASSEWEAGSDAAAGLDFDRFEVRWALPGADLTLGRQAVTFGETYFWNPLDVFLGFDPRRFDRDYKAGVDGLRLDVPLGPFAGLNLVGCPGREIDLAGEYADGGRRTGAAWYGSALLARFFANRAGWDLDAQAGKIYGGWQVGGGASGEIGPLEARLEAAYFWAEGARPLPPPFAGDILEDHFTLVAGTGRRFASSLALEAEYLYNGAGDPDALEASLLRVASGASLHLGRNLIGASGSYDLMPILIGSLGGLVSLDDGSVELLPQLTLSVADNADLLLGAILSYGERPTGSSLVDFELQSEFGAYPHAFYLELKSYF